MFEKAERKGMIVYLYYNRDVKKLREVGDLLYHSKKHRFVQIYVPAERLEVVVADLSKEKFVKQVRTCHIQDLDTQFVGNLYRTEENAII